jgi:hypothetical protein
MIRVWIGYWQNALEDGLVVIVGRKRTIWVVLAIFLEGFLGGFDCAATIARYRAGVATSVLREASTWLCRASYYMSAGRTLVRQTHVKQRTAIGQGLEERDSRTSKISEVIIMFWLARLGRNCNSARPTVEMSPHYCRSTQYATQFLNALGASAQYRPRRHATSPVSFFAWKGPGNMPKASFS